MKPLGTRHKQEKAKEINIEANKEVKIGVCDWVFMFENTSINIKTVTKEKAEYFSDMGNQQIEIEFWRERNNIPEFLKNNNIIEVERNASYRNKKELNLHDSKIIKKIEYFPPMRIIKYQENKQNNDEGYLITIILEGIWGTN